MNQLEEELIRTRKVWAGMTRPELQQAREALEPFAHPDLSKAMGGNVQGDGSPVFGRDKAILTLGDFRRAREIIEERDQWIWD